MSISTRSSRSTTRTGTPTNGTQPSLTPEDDEDREEEGVRRSSRPKRKVASIYEDAKNEIVRKKIKHGPDSSQSTATPQKKSNNDDDDDGDDDENDDREEEENNSGEQDEAEEEEEDDDSQGTTEEEESDEEEPEDRSRNKTTNSPKPSPKNKKREESRPPNNNRSKKQPPTRNQKRNTTAAASARRSVTAALSALSRKVLHASESPIPVVSVADEDDTTDDEDSTTKKPKFCLVAALLQAHKDTQKKNKKRMILPIQSMIHQETIYTNQLQAISQYVMETHKQDPNRCIIDLLNLLFRSIGGTHETNLNADNIDIDDMKDIEWNDFVNDLYHFMEETPMDCVLLCADPEGAVHAHKKQSDREPLQPAEAPTPASLGVREYRRIYEEFWYVLGYITLSGNHANHVVPFDTAPKTKKKGASADEFSFAGGSSSAGMGTTSRFSIEFIRDLMVRLIELVTLNQPDIRAAATIALLQLSHAALDHTIDIKSKLEVATRQYNIASQKKKIRTNNSSKADALKEQMDSLNRTCEELEDIVLGTTMKGVFIHRYRDSNMHIRATCLQSLSKMIIQRPDLFLMDKFLKYFGWMLSDKASCVRKASVDGILTPFHYAMKQQQQEVKQVTTKKKNRKNTSVGYDDEDHDDDEDNDKETIMKIHKNLFPLDIACMENFINKFLPRLADCVLDIDIQVQEKAMGLLLILLREGFLDDWDNENAWTQINSRAIADNTSPTVRKYSLYFVIDQLDPFEDEDTPNEMDNEEDGGKTRKKDISPEMRQIERIDSLASWIAHCLSDGDVPIEEIRLELTNYVVHSLRQMPKYKSLITDWSAMLRAILKDQNNSQRQRRSSQRHRDDDDSDVGPDMMAKNTNRAEIAKQRVLLQMLVCAADLEAGGNASSGDVGGDNNNVNIKSGGVDYMLHDIIDPDLLAAQQKLNEKNNIIANDDDITFFPTITTITSNNDILTTTKKTNTKKKNSALPHETLTIELLKSLPNLLMSFKSDTLVLRNLTCLPRYINISAASNPQMKKDFKRLYQNLCDVFLVSTDTIVLQNAAMAMTFLARGDHARKDEALLKLKDTANSIYDRLIQLYADRKEQQSLSSPSPTKKKQRQQQRSSSKKKKKRSSGSKYTADSDSDDSGSVSVGGNVISSVLVDIEHGISLCLKRLRILSKRWYIGDLLDDSEDKENSLSGEADAEGEEELTPFGRKKIDVICTCIAKGTAEQLKEREVQFKEMSTADADRDSQPQPQMIIPDCWKSGDQKVHSAVADSISESLTFLLTLAAWKLHNAIQRRKQRKQQQTIDVDNLDNDDEKKNFMDDDSEDDEDEEKEQQTREKGSIARLRDCLLKLIGLCFDQYIEDNDNNDHDDDDEDDDTSSDNKRKSSLFSPEHLSFADKIQIHAGRIANDLRSLFPKEWAESSSSLLRSCALTEDGTLIGGYVRFFRSKENKLREFGEKAQNVSGNNNGSSSNKEEKIVVSELLLPIARGLCATWLQGNRREAGKALAHFTGSGKEATKVVAAMSRVLKKIEPVRLLESHMACIRQSYEDWFDNEPDEPESDNPTDEELGAFQEAERIHAEHFKSIEQRAGRLSSSLGVGNLKLSDQKLAPALLGFVKEGVRYAFSNEEAGGEDELVLGSRLSFLLILNRYLNWIRRKKRHIRIIKQVVQKKSIELCNHSEFEEVREEDIEALGNFRLALGLSKSIPSTFSEDKDGAGRKGRESSDDESVGLNNEDDGRGDANLSQISASRKGSLRKKLPRGSSVSSTRSKLSTATSLSPLVEEYEAIDEDMEDVKASGGFFSPSATSQISSALSSASSHMTAASRQRNTGLSLGSPPQAAISGAIEEEDEESSSPDDMEE